MLIQGQKEQKRVMIKLFCQENWAQVVLTKKGNETKGL